MPKDLEKYRPYLSDFDMSEEQKTEFIKVMWTIMQSFADQAFGLNSEQQIHSFHQDKNCPVTFKMVEGTLLSHLGSKTANDNQVIVKKKAETIN